MRSTPPHCEKYKPLTYYIDAIQHRTPLLKLEGLGDNKDYQGRCFWEDKNKARDEVSSFIT